MNDREKISTDISSEREKQRNLFGQMLRIRMVEEAIAKEYQNQKMRCPVHLCIGQEAIAVGVCAHLTKQDIIMSGHRSHGHYLAKGGSLKHMLAEIYGKETGCSRGWGGSQHLIDQAVNMLGTTPIVAETIPIAVGTALAAKMRASQKTAEGEKKERKSLSVTVVFFGDGAMEEGVTHESLNYAVLKKLPVVFVCENNLYSVNTHIRNRQPQREIWRLAGAHGMPAGQHDGNDVRKVYEEARRAIAHAKQGKGPVFLEFRTYRWLEHCGPNEEPKGYRPEKEVREWKRKDPIARLREDCKKKGVLTEETMEEIRKAVEREIEAAFQFAKRSPYPKEYRSQEIVS